MCGIECAVDLRPKTTVPRSNGYTFYYTSNMAQLTQRLNGAFDSTQPDDSFRWFMNETTFTKLGAPTRLKGIKIMTVPFKDDLILLAKEDYVLGRKGDSPKPKEETPRGHLLTSANNLVNGDRNNQYGPPTQDFQRTAEALNAYGFRGPGDRALESHDVAIIQMVLKISRLMWTPQKEDSWTDIAGYAACGYECALEEAKDGSND